MKLKPTTQAAAIACGILIIAWLAIPQPPIPRFDQVRARWRPSDAQLLDRHGEPIHEVRIDRHGRRLAWTWLDDISPALIRVIIASEDRRFPSHHGVDFLAFGGSLRSWIAAGRARGASTITMQLAALLAPELIPAGRRRGLWQKLIQIKTAFALEHRWSKRQILEAYLNLATYRGELQGVAAAARVMFGKQPQGINSSEAIVLAALLKAPNARRDALARRAQGLRLAMAADAPALAEVGDAIGRALAHRGNDFKRTVLAPGLAERWLHAHPSLRCTLDRGLQSFAAQTLRTQILEVRDRHVQDGAVLVVENATGEIWAYVAGTGDLSSAPYVDGVRAERQPGSTLKPFLYALAVQRRLLTPASLLLDTPLELPEERGLYRPLDYDRQFRGLVSMRTALASSLNVPAVRTADLVGVEALADHLRHLGFAEIVEQGDYYGASLALGSADVSLWNLVNAYRTLANGGVLSPMHIFLTSPAPRPVVGDSALSLSHIQLWERVRVGSDAPQVTTNALAQQENAQNSSKLAGPSAPSPVTRLAGANRAPTSPGVRLRPGSAGAGEVGSGVYRLFPVVGKDEGSDTLQESNSATRQRRAHLRSRHRLPDFRHPRRSRQPQRHLRTREQSRHPLLERGQNRDQQGHARQLVRGFYQPLHRGRVGRQFFGCGDARRYRNHRRGAGLARSDELPV